MLVVLSATPVRASHGATGTRYVLRRDHPVAGHAATDRALSTFDAVVLQPARRTPDETPVVTLLNGITRGLDRTLAAGAHLAAHGIAAVAFDTPLGGRRTLAPSLPGNLAAIAASGARLDLPFAHRVFGAVADDLGALLTLAAERHGLGEGIRPGGRLALFGISFGCLLSAYAFGRDARGARLLGAIGHPDVAGMARGLADTFVQHAGVPPAVVAGGLRLGPLAEAAARRYGGDAAVGALRLARLLDTLSRGGGPDPLSYASRVAPERRVAFLAGADDPVAPPSAVRASAEHYPTHAVEVLPQLGHGWYPTGGGSFQSDLNGFLLRHLADWTG